MHQVTVSETADPCLAPRAKRKLDMFFVGRPMRAFVAGASAAQPAAALARPVAGGVGRRPAAMTDGGVGQYEQQPGG